MTDSPTQGHARWCRMAGAVGLAPAHVSGAMETTVAHPTQGQKSPGHREAPRGCGPDSRRPEGKSREGSWGCTEGPASAHWAVGGRALLLRPGAHGAATPLSAQLDVQLASRRAAVNSASLSLPPSVHPLVCSHLCSPTWRGHGGNRQQDHPRPPQRSFPLRTVSPQTQPFILWCVFCGAFL